MNFREILQLSLQARFRLAALVSAVSFIAIALLLLGSFIQVRSDIRQVVGVHLGQAVDSSRQARELGEFIAKLKLLEATFYGNEEYLLQEGAVLLKMINQHNHLHNETLKDWHNPLRKNLAEYLEQCRQVNELLSLLRREEKGLDEIFIVLEELIAEQMIKSAQQGKPADFYEQLTFLVANYRIALLEIIQLDAREKPESFFNASFFDPPPNAALVSNLILQLKTLISSEPPIDRFGQHLIDQLKYYQHLMRRFQQEMIHLGQRSAELNHLTEGALREMAALDWRHEELAGNAVELVDQRIKTVGIVVLGLLLVLALLFGLILLNLFSRHVKKPMMAVHKRLLSFQQGDYSSPMSLGRRDEWGQVETVFNNMLGDLVESWTAVQESERRYRNIFDSAAFGIFQSSTDGALLNVNPALALMFGVDAYEEYPVVRDLGEMIYVDPQDRQRLIERLLQEETVSNYEVRMKRTSGELFWASITCHLVLGNDEKVQFVEGTVEDISLRRQAEEELRNLKEYLHEIVDTMPSILIGVDENLQVSLWNQQVVDRSGLTAEQALDKPLAEVFSLVDPSFYLTSVQQTLKTTEVVRLRKIPGSEAGLGHFFDLLIYPLRALGTTGVVIHMDDVTDKVQIEEVMVQSEKMLSVGSLAAGMAHEINNPLASVLQNVQVMDQRLSPALKKNRDVAEQLGIQIEQVAEYAQRRGFNQMIKSIADAGQRAARIIENMLNFSRKSSSSFLPCSLSDLAEKTIELAGSDYDMKHHFDFRTINLVRDYQSVPDVPCESSQIQQVILNLLKNAAQALGSQPENPEIRIRVFRQKNQVCLQVEDNGEGMDEETRRRIFEPFYTTKEVGHGTGLGLSVSYFLITENHKGSLTVTSKPGAGTCFSVLLPIERMAAKGE